MPSIDPTNSNSAATEWASLDSAGAGAQSRIPVTTLQQDDFLKLLVTQMTTQDPMKPMDDMEFFSQLSQFSALEQSKSMQANMAVLHANSMLGKEVQVKGKDGVEVNGVVTHVDLLAGTPKLIVNGERYDLESIQIVNSATNNQNPILDPLP